MYKHITKSRSNHIVVSFLNDATMNVNNNDSKKYCYWLEMDAQVRSYRTGGGKVFLLNTNLSHTSYTPDFTVERKNAKTQVVFIDRKAQLTNCIMSKLSSAYLKNNQIFVRILPQQIHVNPYLQNAEFLYRYAWDRTNFEHHIVTYNFFQNHSAVTLEDFQLHLESEGLQRSTVFKLIFDHRISIDMTKKIDENTIVRIGENQDIRI